MGDVIELFGLAHADDGPGPVYCDCGEPTPGWWGLECAACRRLIAGSIREGLAR